MSGVITAGSTKQISMSPVQSNAEPNPLRDIRPIGPTRPHVPIPEETALFSAILKLKIHVAIGPVITDASVGGIHMRGFLQMLPI